MTTVSEIKPGKAVQEEIPPDGTPESLRREGRTCATSVTPADPDGQTAVTVRVPRADHLKASAGQLAIRASAILDRPGSLIHSQPPTFKQSRDRHHECAGHYEALILRWPRLLWGYFHLLIVKPLLNGLEWVTESPLRFFVALAIAAVVWYFR